MGYLLILLIAFGLFAVPMMALFTLALAALTIFVVRRLFPLGLGIAEWVANRRNLMPFILHMIIVIVVAVLLMNLAYFLAVNGNWIGYLLLMPLSLLLAIAATIFGGGMTLAITLWIVRLIQWEFAGFRKAWGWAIRSKHAPKLAPQLATHPRIGTYPGVKPHYRGRQRVGGLAPLVSPAEEKAKQKAKAKARGEAKAKAQAIQKARPKELAEAQAFEKDRAKALAKAQANAKAKAKALAEAQAKVKPKKTRSEGTSKPRRRRRLRPRPRPGQKH